MPPIPFYGESLAMLTALLWAICIFPFTEGSRRMGTNEINHFRLLLAFLMLSVLTMLAYRYSPVTLFTHPSSGNWLWLGLSGILGFAVGDHYSFRMYAILGTRIGSLFNTLAPGAALLFGYFILDEHISLKGICGIAITVSGVSWLTMTKEEKSKIPDYGFGKAEKGIIAGILSALCQGIGLVLSKKGLIGAENAQTLAPLHATWIRLCAATAAIYLFTIVRGELRKVNAPVLENRNNGVPYAIAGTIFGPVAGVAVSMYAIALIKVSVAQTIFSLLPVLVLPIGYFWNKEKITAKSLAGALVAITGVIVLIWGG